MGAGGASGPEGTANDDSGMGVSQMASELHGADPTFILKSLQQVKQQLSQLFVQPSMRLPNVSQQIANAMTQLARAIQDAPTATSTTSLVRTPLGVSAAAAGCD